MSCWRRMKNIKWSEGVINKEVLEFIGENVTLLNNICLVRLIALNIFYKEIEWEMTELKGVERRRMKHLDDLRNRRRYSVLKEEDEDLKKSGNECLSQEHRGKNILPSTNPWTFNKQYI